MTLTESPTAAIPVGTWTIDPAWSNIGYQVKHMGVVASRGWFRSFSGVVEMREDGGRVHGIVDLGSLDTGDWARDEHVKGRLFLAYEDFPALAFESKSIEIAANGSVEIKGDLSLHGVTRESVLRGEVVGVDSGRLGLALTGEISRKAFNLRFNRILPSGTPVVADRVELILDLTAVRQLDDGPLLPSETTTDGELVLQRVSNPHFGSANSYLVGDPVGRTAILIDAGGPVAPLLDTVEARGLSLSHVLLTHHHLDHTADLNAVVVRHPAVEVLVHPDERALVGRATGTIEPGATLASGGLVVEAILTGGHTSGGLSFLVNGRVLYSGDTLYRDTISTVEMSGHTTFADLRAGLERLLKLPGNVQVFSGHGEPTTIERERAENPFVRVLLGDDGEGDEECTVLGRPARIIVLGTDGHGSERCWIRWDQGSDDIVPGVVVERG